MTRIALVSLLAFTTAGARADDAKKAAESVQGSWKPVKVEKDGRPEKDAALKSLTFSGETFTLHEGNTPLTGPFTLDTKAAPMTVDLAPKGTPFVVKGVWKIEKDQLILCFALDGEDRPKDLVSRKGTSYVVFERTKK